MCLYPRLIRNKKYTANKKNGGQVPPVSDPRVLYVPIGCQKCIECRKQRAREWQVRLHQEVSKNQNAKFITLTFSNEHLDALKAELPDKKGYELENAAATLAVRRFLERWRKRFKKSVKHWLVTELGTTRTERIHLHGIIWTTESKDTIAELWRYGWVWAGYNDGKENYVNGRTVNYITKYITKTDLKHKGYISKILTSPGIGSGYEKTFNARKNKYDGQLTDESYRLPSGHKTALPIYYRNKIYSEEEREKLWLHRLDRNERWICGEMVRADNTEGYMKLLNYYRRRNNELGYGNNKKTWDEEQYTEKQQELLRLRR